MAESHLFQTPQRLLFIASIGNKAPYHKTRHSAGHVLLEALTPRLLSQMPTIELPHYTMPTYQTWRSPSWMNHSGKRLSREVEDWIFLRSNDLKKFYSTLVILHDELEAPLGKLRVRRGGPEAASLRGHRGLIDVMETLQKKHLYPPQKNRGPARDLSILRVGVGIGRPLSRERVDVAEYVLGELPPMEMDAVQKAADPILDILIEEVYREREGT